MTLEATRERSVVGIAGRRACIDDQIHSRQLMLMMAKRLADQALDVIAPNRITDNASGNRQSQAGRLSAGAAREDCEEGIGRAARIAIDAIEFGFLPEALCRLKRPCVRQASREWSEVRQCARVAQTVRRLRPFARRRAST
jgi:hypothetical protein